MTTISSSLQPYVPASFLDSSGNLKDGISVDKATTVAQGIQAKVDKLPEAQRDMVLSLLKNADTAPSADLSPEQISAAVGLLTAAASFLSSLSTTDTASLIARLMIETAADQRKNALDDRLAARDQAKSNLMSQADEMVKSAGQMMTGAIVALVVTVVMSVISIAAAGVGAVKGGSALKDMKGAGGDEAAMKIASQAGQNAGNWNTAGQTASALGNAASQGASGITQSNAKMSEAQGSKDAAMAQEAQSAADMAKDVHQAIDDLLKAIVNFLKEMQDAENQMMQTLTRV